MAIWQFCIDFIPRKKLIQQFGEIPKTIVEEILWKDNFEEGVNLPNNYENFLRPLGKKGILEWRGNSFNWGDYDKGNHITIDVSDINKASVYCRFHVGEMDENFIKTVLEFAKNCDCVLLTKNETVIEPEFDLFVEEIKKSNSYRFCKDPVGYLQSDEVKQLNEKINKKLLNDEFDFNR
jgi:hypothetical protein